MLPVATASIPWQIVLVIIAFNILAGIMSKNQKKAGKNGPQGGKGPQGADKQEEARRRMEAMRKRMEASRESAEKAKAEAERRRAEARSAEREAARRKLEERQAREARDRAAEEAEATGEAGDFAEADYDTADAGSGRGAARNDAPDGNPASRGRGLLEQLARELGLELPTPQPHRPPSRSRSPSSTGPSAGSSGESRQGRVEGRTGASPSRSIGHPEGAAKPEQRRQTRSAEDEGEGSDGIYRAPAPTLPAAKPVRAQTGATGAVVSPADLSDPEALRKAFVLKTLLDKPLALRPRR